MIKKLVTTATIISISLLLISWGSVGHYKISQNVSLSFNSEMSEFNSWVPYLTDHATDADNRKNWDTSEGKKHYIDIDNYSEFTATGTIPQSYIDAVNAHGSTFVNSNGILPWATIAAFDSLRVCLQRHDWNNAKQYAADLGHYVGDGHMPLHLTDNYDGDNTGNNGIHSRYESTMIGTYSSQITYTGSSISVINNVNQYVFSYIYENNKYVDSVLNADNYAKTFGSTSSSEYKQALWDKTKGFTTKLFKNGSHALAELIYTAWVQAGKPSLTSTSDPINNLSYSDALEQNIPNPFSYSTKITIKLTECTDVSLQVKDLLGKNISIIYKGTLPTGTHTFDWVPANNLNEGIYFIVLDSKRIHQVRKMLLAK